MRGPALAGGAGRRGLQRRVRARQAEQADAVGVDVERLMVARGVGGVVVVSYLRSP